jgi:hypothetical protein
VAVVSEGPLPVLGAGGGLVTVVDATEEGRFGPSWNSRVAPEPAEVVA